MSRFECGVEGRTRGGENSSGGEGKKWRVSRQSRRCTGWRRCVVVGGSDEEGGEGCGSCGGCGVCEGEACDTEMGGFLSLHMSDR